MAIADDYYLLQGRQKFIELRCFSDEGGTIHDPDLIPVTIVQQPTHGTLTLERGTTYRYLPSTDPTPFVGDDCLIFSCGSSPVNMADVNLHVTEDFVPPFGLGEPEFGVEEDWTDYTHPPGSVFTINLGTTPLANYPTTLNPGDVVLLEGVGIIPPAASTLPIWEVTALGTCTAPIFIRGLGPDNRATLRRPLHIRGNYVIIEHINFSGFRPSGIDPVIDQRIKHWVRVKERVPEEGGGGGPTPIDNSAMQGGWEEQQAAPPLTPCPIIDPNDSTHIAVRHCRFVDHPLGADSGVVAVLFGATSHQEGSPNNSVTGVADCVAYDILVANFGDWQAPCQGTPPNPTCPKDYYGAGGESNSVDTWIIDSIFHHMQGGGVGLSRNNAMSFQASARKGWIGRNVIHHVREYGIAVKMAQDSILSQNKIYRVRKTPTTSTGGGIYIGNNDRCNQYVNATADRYSDNVWAIFNHIYDVQTGVSIDQQVFCGGGGCCCLDCPETPTACPDHDSCCSPGSPAYGMDYDSARVYAVGNVIDHVLPFGQTPRDDFGQALRVVAQSQVRAVNNTIYKCAQGLEILCTHSIGPCPPYGDPALPTRNTSVGFINNIILDPVDDGDNDSHLRICTGPYASPGYEDLESTLTEADFDYNLHYPAATMYVKLPNDISNFCTTVECLRQYVNQEHDLDWANNSFDHHHPHLQNPEYFDFRASPISQFQFLGKPNDAAYGAFQSAFGRSIYHDYEGNAYGNACSIGAFEDSYIY